MLRNNTLKFLNLVKMQKTDAYVTMYRRLSLARTLGDQAFYNELSVLRGINFMTLHLAKLQNVALHRLLNLL